MMKRGFLGQLKLVSATAPSLAARMAEGLFLKTRRFPAPEEEKRVLARGAVSRVKRGQECLRIWVWGRGPTVLLVHGWNGRGGQLASFVDPLVQTGFRAVAFDGAGHGSSTGDSSSMPWLAEDVLAVAAAFGPLHGVITHSLGGLSTLLALSRGLPCQRAVLLAPPAYPVKWFQLMSERLDLPPSVQRLLLARLHRRFDAGFDDLSGPQLARDLMTPALVIHDRQDRDVDLEDGRALADAWPGCRLQLTDGLGHLKILQNPDVVASALGFIRGPLM
jgi:pimeloyl-ACP methyl ester carboxylesterase